LTGEVPYDFPDSTRECLAMILNEDVRPIQRMRPDVPRDLADIIHTGLAREPEDRYPDADSMRSALSPWDQSPG
jgi:eukaryotic-like serine/threonine-protein kinase